MVWCDFLLSLLICLSLSLSKSVNSWITSILCSMMASWFTILDVSTLLINKLATLNKLTRLTLGKLTRWTLDISKRLSHYINVTNPSNQWARFILFYMNKIPPPPTPPPAPPAPYFSPIFFTSIRNGCRIWNNGRILMFKVSKWPYQSPHHDRIICKLCHCLTSVQKWN